MKLPCDECKGKCCTYPGFTRREFKTVRAKYGIPKGTNVKSTEHGGGFTVYLPGGDCPFLVKGRCSIYKDRPMTCQIYGEIPQLPCQYLYPEESRRMVNGTINMMRDFKNTGVGSAGNRRG